MGHLQHVFFSWFPHLTVCLNIALERTPLFLDMGAEIFTVQKSHELFVLSLVNGQRVVLPLSTMMQGNSLSSSLQHPPGQDETEQGCKGTQTWTGALSLLPVCLAQGFNLDLVQDSVTEVRNKAAESVAWDLGGERKGSAECGLRWLGDRRPGFEPTLCAISWLWGEGKLT